MRGRRRRLPDVQLISGLLVIHRDLRRVDPASVGICYCQAQAKASRVPCHPSRSPGPHPSGWIRTALPVSTAKSLCSSPV